jgi:hypothetical protein
MKKDEKDNVAIGMDIDIEVLAGREDVLVAAAGSTCCCTRGPQIQIVAIPE